MLTAYNINSDSVFDTGLGQYEYDVEGAQTLEDAAKHLILAAYAINQLALKDKLNMPDYARLMRTFVFHHDFSVIGAMDDVRQKRNIVSHLHSLADLYY
jgi:hypothetical protein